MFGRKKADDSPFGRKSKSQEQSKDIFGRQTNRKKSASELFAEKTNTPALSTEKEKHQHGKPSVQHEPTTKKGSVQSTAQKPSKVNSRPTEDPLKRLNSDQYDAATVEMGRNLIIASAGTGKTSTIMGRISYLINKCSVLPEEIMLLTFTSKAAKEMTERIEIFFGHQVSKRILTGTFHSTSLKLVRNIRKGDSLKMPRDAALLFQSVFGHRTLPEAEDGKPFSAKTIYEKYGMFLNTNIGAKGFSEWLSEKHPDQEAFAYIFEDICEEFEQLKKKEKFYDFNDLLLIARDFYLSEKCPYREIIVDEYQDTNVLQSALLDAMSPESLYCVGDYDQSIYAFNGADINIIGSFSTRYKNSRVSTLRKNYRSSRSIIGIAEKVIAINPRLYPKGIEVMMSENPHEPKLRKPTNKDEQAREVVSSIKQDLDYKETAVIYRGNSSGDDIEVALKEAEIPYTRKGDKSFFDAKDILAFISIFKIVTGDSSLPTFLQAFEISGIRTSSLHLIHHGYHGYGHGDVRKGIVSPDLSQEKKAFFTKTSNAQLGVTSYGINKSLNHIQAISDGHHYRHPVMAYEAVNKEIYYLMLSMFDIVRKTDGISNSRKVVDIIAESIIVKRIYTKYAASFSRDSSGAIVEAELKKNMDKMFRKIEVLKKIADKKKTIKAFLNEITVKKEDEEATDAVQLLSVHASKGLEFKNVHIVDMIEDTFPNTKLMNNGGGGIEEERRLFYVGVTRAKHKLLFYFPEFDTAGKKYEPSRFLREAGFSL